MTDSVESQAQIRRQVRVYIDGFNLYHAIATLKEDDLKWINYWNLSLSLLKEGEILDEVNLFTAVLTWNYNKQKRHVNFIRACEAVGVRVHNATFKRSFRECQESQRTCRFFEEKQTDVAIAVKLVADALTGGFDRAILMTADSDQIPAARFVSQLPNRSLTLIFPPGRKKVARELGAVVADRRELTSGHLRTCRLPRTVRNEAGKVVATMPALYERPISN